MKDFNEDMQRWDIDSTDAVMTYEFDGEYVEFSDYEKLEDLAKWALDCIVKDRNHLNDFSVWNENSIMAEYKESLI